MKKIQIPEILKWSRELDKIFRIDGLSLRYFLESLINSSYLPKPFKTKLEIEKDIKIHKHPSRFENLKNNIYAFVLRKGLATNEMIKLLISKLGKRNWEDVGKKDVLFVAFTDQVFEKDGRLEFAIFGKIIHSLREGEADPLILICDPISKNSFLKLRKYDLLLYSYITPEIIKKSKELANDLNKKWRNLDEKLKIKLFAIKEKNYWKFFERDMDILFSKELLSTLIKYYLTFKNILKKRDIKVVYLTSLVGIYELAILAAAHKLDKKIVYVSHGYTWAPRESEFIKNIIIAASGPEEKRNFIKGGIKEKNIFVTGSPFYDGIIEYKQKKVQRRAKKIVCLLTTALVESKIMKKKKYFELIRQTLAQVKSVREVGKVIIKIHPRERYKSEYESIVKSLDMRDAEVIQGTTKAELYSIIANSDLLIGFGSTALLEGLMIGKDVIHLDMFLNNPGSYAFRKGALCTSKISELAELIKKVFSNKSTKSKLKMRRESYLQDSFYKIDGKAHERVANLIVSLIRKG